MLSSTNASTSFRPSQNALWIVLHRSGRKDVWLGWLHLLPDPIIPVGIFVMVPSESPGEWIPNTYQDGDPSAVSWISRITATERVQVTSLPAGAPWDLSKTMSPFGLWVHELFSNFDQEADYKYSIHLNGRSKTVARTGPTIGSLRSHDQRPKLKNQQAR